MLPGPVPMPERVRAAMMRQAINHRGKEFSGVYADCVRILKTAFGTGNDLFVISGSGTAAMEAAVGNFGRVSAVGTAAGINARTRPRGK